MSGDVTVDPANERVTVEVTYEVADAPIVQKRYAKTLRFQPDSLIVTFIDGQLRYCQLSGPRVLKDRLGSRESQTYHDFDDDLPEWVRPYIGSPPRKPRPTVLVTNDDLARILAGSAMGCGGYTEIAPDLPPEARKPAEFTVRLYTPMELLEAAGRARKAIADTLGKPGFGEEMTLAQAASLTRSFDLWELTKGLR